ncbi:MAG: adaptive-response sensory kinase [Methanoregulaceae archaeon PtaU1.Bin222]|jgi:signal transduction histidine kinase/DNA-binding response OmpR family regulator|nr:MAG: adaptive-response sensory kinase [Methanoregulaceae archaeon PtaU1.Bin222]
MFNVLVVDDDDQFLSLFRQKAASWTGVKIDTATSMKEAEEFLKNTPCDMVISEYSLGEKNGIDLLRYIRSRHGEIPFILLTSYSDGEIAAEASRFGISAYFIKKVDLTPLFSEVYGKIREEMKKKELVENLRERESRCRTILESQPGLICRFEPDLILTFVNRAFTQLMETSPENLIGTCITDYIQPEDRNTFSDAIKALSPVSHSAMLDLKIHSPYRNPERNHLIAWTFTAAFSEGHTPALIQGTGMDVSREREHVDEQARQLENLAFLSRTAMEFVDMEESDDIFRFIAEKVYSLLPHSAVVVTTHDSVAKTFTIRTLVGDDDILSAIRYWLGRDLEGLVLRSDQYTFPKIGLTKKGFIEGPSLYHLFIFMFPEEACKRIEESCSLGKIYLIGCSSKGELFGHVTFALRKGDTVRNPELIEAFVNQASVALLRWKARKAAEEEITKVHAGLEQVVAERTAALQAANRNLESFSYSVSHDLRTPLRSIEGFSSILQKEHGKDLSPDGTQMIEKIRQNTLRMADLIDAILEFSRAGRKELQRERIDVQTMAREVLDELAASRPGQQIDIVIGDLPPCMADPILMHQVLQNLLSNALKFSRCRDTSKIEVGSYDNGGRTVYFVRDNGIGVDMKYADRLFHVFEQLHDDKKYEGTGIGLAIVDNIIRRHGGKVWIESEIDKGFSCYFTTGGGNESVNY